MEIFLMDNLIVIGQWIIVGIAVFGLIFNTGVIWNDVKHIKKSIDELWKEVNAIKAYLMENPKKERDKK